MNWMADPMLGHLVYTSNNILIKSQPQEQFFSYLVLLAEANWPV